MKHPVKRNSRLAALALLLLPGVATAQTGFRVDTSTGLEMQAPVAQAAEKSRGGGDAQSERQPTEITASKETTFDEKSRTAVFLGDVTVRDAQFHLTCEKLTAHLSKTKASGDAAAAANSGGGLERVVAEGEVVIVQEKADESGKVTRYVGKARRAEYDAATGNLRLSGWPQISQGINTQVATEEGTVMILNRAGAIKTLGPAKTVISESSSDTALPGRPKAGGGGSREGARSLTAP